MFDALGQAPPDPILALAEMARNDPRADRLDLSIGIYVDEGGRSPVMAAVRQAEQRVLDAQTSKAYLPARGNAEFLDRLGERLFPQELRDSGRLMSMQSTGCVAALRLGAEVLRRAGARRIWLSDPTWPIHAPIFQAAGLEPVAYPYYSVGAAEADWPGMLAALETARAGDIVLLHGCCHNPSGADLAAEQWSALARTLRARGALPLIDIAYAGLGRGWDADLAGVRAFLAQIEEAVIAVSCSKSFGLYRERAGALYFLARDGKESADALSHGLVVARSSYSMSPDHGAATVAAILGDPELEQAWQAELAQMRARIAGMRATLADTAAAAGLDLAYLRHQRGMFALLPLSPPEVTRLREDHAVYMPANGRICIPCLSEAGCAHLVRAIMTVRGD